MLDLQRLTLTTVLISVFLPHTTHAFSFWFTSTPTQCANTTVQWSGGQPPFTLLLVPTGHLTPETRTIIQLDIQSANFIEFPLTYPAQSQFVATMSDSTGIGSGGTSVVTTVAQSSTTSCLNTQQVEPKFLFFLQPSDIGQCDSTDISWQSQAEEPIDLLGLIPGGQSFEIANITDSSTSFEWDADVRSGTQILLVAGDKDGLGTGGSTDVMQVADGDSDCIEDSSPSSTAGAPAGGVSSSATANQGSPTQSGGSNPTTSAGGQGGGSSGSGTVTNNGGNGNSGSGTATNNGGGNSGSGTATNNGGGGNSATGTGIVVTGTSVSTSPTGGSKGTGGESSSTSGVPGSGGGTVNGPSSDSSKRSLGGLIAGIVVGVLALIALITGAVFFYRRRTRRRADRYSTSEDDLLGAPRRPFVTRGTHMRGGAGSSSDTLPSMYQTEPFILPPTHPRRPPGVAGFSRLSEQSLMGDAPYERDALGGGIAGAHGPTMSDRKAGTGTHGVREPQRTPSGRVVDVPSGPRGMPPPSIVERPTRVTRDSEDHSPIQEDMIVPANPFDDLMDIPPTYHSVRAVKTGRISADGSASEERHEVRSDRADES